MSERIGHLRWAVFTDEEVDVLASWLDCAEFEGMSGADPAEGSMHPVAVELRQERDYRRAHPTRSGM